ALRTGCAGETGRSLRTRRAGSAGIALEALRSHRAGRAGIALEALRSGRAGIALETLRTRRAGIALDALRTLRTLRTDEPAVRAEPLPGGVADRRAVHADAVRRDVADRIVRHHRGRHAIDRLARRHLAVVIDGDTEVHRPVAEQVLVERRYRAERRGVVAIVE